MLTTLHLPGKSLLRMTLTAVMLLTLFASASPALAQESPADERADTVLQSDTDTAVRESARLIDTPSVPLLELLVKGGWLMVPILLMSIVVVAIGVERALALRTDHVLPEELVKQLGRLAESSVFDPRQAFQLCGRHASCASRVVQAMLLKVGRPHAEVEKTVVDACQRESDRLYSNVRTLNLAATVSPLLGLLGTVWGMIQAFFVTANLPDAANKGEALAQGIYIALVTTFAGLAVAIPATVLAHIFEVRILQLLRQVEDLADSLLPQVERYEGKLRLDRQRLESNEPVRKKPTSKQAQAAATAPGPN